MWWKNKIKNRRSRRDEVLEVKVHSQKVRAARWRLAVTALSVSVGALITMLLVWRVTEWTVRVVVIQNEALAVRKIEVQTDGVIAPEQIRQWAGVKVGDFLMGLDLPRIRRNLELPPLIKHAAVERILPDTLRVRINEREPLAEAHVLAPRPDESGYDIAAYYLDEEGYVMLPLERGMRLPLPSAATDALTIITGLGRADMRPGKPVESPQVMAALKLIQIFENSPMFGYVDLARIDLSSPDVLQVTTSRGGEITFGMNGLDNQFQRWRAIYDFGAKAGKAIASLDLSVSNNVPALWVEASALPPEKPRPAKTIRHRRNHV